MQLCMQWRMLLSMQWSSNAMEYADEYAMEYAVELAVQYAVDFSVEYAVECENAVGYFCPCNALQIHLVLRRYSSDTQLCNSFFL